MQRNVLILYLFLIVLLFSSCTKIIKICYGVHNPRLESQKEILSYAEKEGD